MADRNGMSWISSEGVRRAKSALAVAVSFAIIIGAMGFVTWKGYDLYMDWRQKEDYIGDGDGPVEVYIAPGLSTGAIADLLKQKEVIQDPTVFEQEVRKMPEGTSIQSGTYNLLLHIPAKLALDMLLDVAANKVVIKLQINEGWRLDQIKRALVDNLSLTMEEVDQALVNIAADPVNLIDLNPLAGSNPEGYLFPDTYNFEPHQAYTAFHLMARQFNTVASEIDLTGKAAALSAALGFEVTPQQVVVVASIIEAEVNRDEDRPKVARAIYNRLAIGMPLKVESIFRHGRLAIDGIPYEDPITEISQNDPTLVYNYYIHSGIPTSPISNPGRAALEAAAAPAEGDWIYWTTTNLYTGETGFASDEAGFEELRQQLIQWCGANGNPTGCQ